MRRSKSDPAKYARNYRKISQRHMTQYDNIDEEKEMERLRAVLKNSEDHLSKHTTEAETDDKPKAASITTSGGNKRKKRKSRENNDNDDDAQEHQINIETSRDDDEPANNILSGDLLEQSYGETDENPLIVLPSKKKAKKSKPKVQLTAEEIKEAKNLQKKTSRKLQQLEQRAAQKKRRAELLQKLSQSQLSKTAVPLLSSSGSLSRKNKDTKKQKLQKLLLKERAGIELTEDEKDLLYPEKVIDEESEEAITAAMAMTASVVRNDEKSDDEHSIDDDDDDDDNNDYKTFERQQQQPKKTSGGSSSDKKMTKKQKMSETQKRKYTASDVKNALEDDTKMTTESSTKATSSSKSDKKDRDDDSNKKDEKEEAKNPPGGTIDFAALMMASLGKLKEDTKKSPSKEKESADSMNALDTSDTVKEKYVPTAPTILKAPASIPSMHDKSQQVQNQQQQRTVMRIQRPAEVEAKRLDLPVSAMEFEIMDAIRNNDVTIICGETGSGKSTQIPQYLYEGGFCTNDNSDNDSSNSTYLVGITQPRRVAAVSTAKRVCYEMGQGDGQTIKGSGGKGNLVSYRTRYEKAGIGSKTRVQFMTDGILLQEIQNDLLLRKYSVIVLDESHERNLNTDVLIGLLSAALPLRKKAAEEDPTLVPLKLVLMSATLRVADFTENANLFQGSSPPVVVKVPGRTHPVTIHHSKTTELDDYGKTLFCIVFVENFSC